MKRIEKRHKSYKAHEFVTEKYELIQRIILFIIMISCIALIAIFFGLF